MPLPQDASRKPSPSIADAISGKPMLDSLLERNTEHAFLKLLITQDTSKRSRQLQNSLAQAERDEKCIRRAVFLMVVLLMLSLAGLSYCAILLPDVFRNPRHLVLRSLCDLGLGSLISQLAFLGYLLWHRVGVSRLHGECRLVVLALAKSRLLGGAVPILAADPPGKSPGAPDRGPAPPAGMPPDARVRLEAVRSRS